MPANQRQKRVISLNVTREQWAYGTVFTYLQCDSMRFVLKACSTMLLMMLYVEFESGHLCNYPILSLPPVSPSDWPAQIC